MTDDEALGEVAFKGAQVRDMLLTEIVAALIAKGVLGTEDVAGAILRLEHRAELADGIDAADRGDISGLHGEIARQHVEFYRSRFALEPDLYTLRKLQMEWMALGSKGENPLEAASVVELYREDE